MERGLEDDMLRVLGIGLRYKYDWKLRREGKRDLVSRFALWTPGLTDLSLLHTSTTIAYATLIAS
jgi:hypothetical protein